MDSGFYLSITHACIIRDVQSENKEAEEKEVSMKLIV
jgi:hypothetical protein